MQPLSVATRTHNALHAAAGQRPRVHTRSAMPNGGGTKKMGIHVCTGKQGPARLSGANQQESRHQRSTTNTDTNTLRCTPTHLDLKPKSHKERQVVTCAQCTASATTCFVPAACEVAAGAATGFGPATSNPRARAGANGRAMPTAVAHSTGNKGDYTCIKGNNSSILFVPASGCEAIGFVAATGFEAGAGFGGATRNLRGRTDAHGRIIEPA